MRVTTGFGLFLFTTQLQIPTWLVSSHLWVLTQVVSIISSSGRSVLLTSISLEVVQSLSLTMLRRISSMTLSTGLSGSLLRPRCQMMSMFQRTHLVFQLVMLILQLVTGRVLLHTLKALLVVSHLCKSQQTLISLLSTSLMLWRTVTTSCVCVWFRTLLAVLVTRLTTSV